MIKRNITGGIAESLSDTPVVFLRGARQVGKTTLVKEFIGKKRGADYFTLDTAGVLASASDDPAGFLSGLRGTTIIDEAQKAAGLFAAIKESVDKDRRPGRFLLTGSSNILTSVKAAESLAGRMEIFNLWPLSQGEIEGVREDFIDCLFRRAEFRARFNPETREDILRRAAMGGYPEVRSRASEKRRRAWFDAYLTSILERDVRDIANIHDIGAMLRLLKALASRAASLVNYSDLSRTLGVQQTTLKRFMAILNSIFLIYEVPAWSANIGKRLVKSPKIMFSDTGLASNLLGCDSRRVIEEPHIAGALLENFVVSEIFKQLAWNETDAAVFHFREQGGKEVDVVLESAAGAIAGVEIKASSSVSTSDFAGLKALKEAGGKKFIRGVVLYTGPEIIPFAKDLYAVPIPALWGARVK